MIKEIKTNCMGTVSFIAKFPRMRKEQDFIVYPVMGKEDSFYIESETRFGQVEIATGNVTISKPCSSGAYAITLLVDPSQPFTLPEPDLKKLKEAIRNTAGDAVGNNVISMTSNNSGAALI